MTVHKRKFLVFGTWYEGPLRRWVVYHAWRSTLEEAIALTECCIEKQAVLAWVDQVSEDGGTHFVYEHPDSRHPKQMAKFRSGEA